MSKQFGKKRVPGCTCTYRSTCVECLRAAGPTAAVMGAQETSRCHHCDDARKAGQRPHPDLGYLGLPCFPCDCALCQQAEAAGR